MSVYDTEAFAARVDYAAQCITRGISGTRHFDTCFEMSDGDAVVAALVRRADKNPALFAAIERYWRGTFPECWRETARHLAHLSRRGLTVEARRQRERAAAFRAAL